MCWATGLSRSALEEGLMIREGCSLVSRLAGGDEPHSPGGRPPALLLPGKPDLGTNRILC